MKIRKELWLFISFLLFLFISSAWAGDSPWKDVSGRHWAFDAIQKLSNAGIVKGFPDKTFKPEQKVTREQFAMVLAKSLNIPLDPKAGQIFSDVPPSHWAFRYIDATKSYIPTPTDPRGKFNFNGTKLITREEVAESLVLALNLKKNPRANEGYLAGLFRDYQNISPVYRENVALAVYNKIMSGSADRNFNGKNPLNRAELCVLMSRLVQATEAKKQVAVAPVVYEPAHKPWTVEFVNFRRPDHEMVEDFPDYRDIQTFLGTVTSTVYNPRESYLVVEHTIRHDSGNSYYTETKTVRMYVYSQDIKYFFVDDLLRINYDRDNNVTSYSFDIEAKPHDYLPPVGGG